MAVPTREINPQSKSPLFSHLPPEIRYNIFELALTAYEDTKKKYSPCSTYYRPGNTCTQRIDTAVLSTCRLAYIETARLPARLNELTVWFYHHIPRQETSGYESELQPVHCPKTFLRRQELRKVHLFIEQLWLESDDFAQFLDLWKHASPTHLTITLRHADWLWRNHDIPLFLDPKICFGRFPLHTEFSKPSDPFEPKSWGSHFQNVRGLQVLQIELETLESRKEELDIIVDHAKGWEIPLGDGKVLIMDDSRTEQTGWVGLMLDENFDSEDDILGSDGGASDDDSFEVSSSIEDSVLTSDASEDASTSQISSSSAEQSHPAETSSITNRSDNPFSLNSILNPPTVKERMEAAGIIFNDIDSVQGFPEDQTCTYYVVSLVWEAHPVTKT